MNNVMKPTKIALLLCTVMTSSVFASSNFKPQIESEKPNIVMIMAEDLSPRFGIYGDTVAKTPNIDAFAKEAVRFTQVYTMAPVSSPNRAGTITGRFQNTTGLHQMRTQGFEENPYVGVPPSNVKAFPELLRANGYFTYNDTKTDYQFSFGHSDIGPFTIWDAHGEYFNLDDLLIPSAWRNYDLQNKPFYMSFNPQITHESALFFRDTAPKQMTPLIDLWAKYRANFTYTPTDPNAIKLEPYFVDMPLVRRDIAQQYDNMQIMDQQVGKIINDLKSDGLWDNTIVIVTTDHGDGIPRHKRDLYDSGLKVPFLVHVPEKYQPSWWKTDGSADERLISFEDLAPTMLGFADVKQPDFMTGLDLSKDKVANRQYVFATRDRMDSVTQRGRTVRNERYSYVRNFDDKAGGYELAFRDGLGITQSMRAELEAGHMTSEQKQWYLQRPKEELFDRVNDPYELHNLAEDPQYHEVLCMMRTALTQWLNKNPDMAVIDEAVMVADLKDENNRQRVTLPPVAEYDQLMNQFRIVNRTYYASIGYRINNGPWLLYSEGFTVPKGTKSIEYKAVRYGWKESDAVTYNFN